jgi:hypothetical protein
LWCRDEWCAANPADLRTGLRDQRQARLEAVGPFEIVEADD